MPKTYQATDYTYTCAKDPHGGFIVGIQEFPGLRGVGKTEDAAMREAALVAQARIDGLRDAGKPLPPPAHQAERRLAFTEVVDLRKDETGFSWSELAGLVGISEAGLHKHRRENGSALKLPVAEKLASALGIQVEDFWR